jgi:heterodisulfide reductase subunit A-like polyferredoxin
MKFLQSKRPAAAVDAASSTVDRRGLVIGAGVAGVAAVAAHALHRGAVEAPVVAAAAKTPAAEGEGYRLSAHVRRYYETTKA